MTATLALVTIAAVCIGTVLAGSFGLRWSRTTQDFYVAGRAVSPAWNAAAIGGEYLSAASFLGIAGLIYADGLDMLWYPVGYTMGFVVLLVLVAAPLRRSGAYTLPDFAETRLSSHRLRQLCTLLVVLIGWLYFVPQLQGAGLALFALTGAPSWVGAMAVTIVVTANVLAGGMRSLTLVQAVHYWVKLIAIAIPAIALVGYWLKDGQPLSTAPWPPVGAGTLPTLGADDGSSWSTLYGSYSTLVALCLGTMGLPHVVVRFYTNPDGRTARRTTVVVIGLLGLFYLFPPVYGMLARIYLPHLPTGVAEDTVTLLLPQVMAPGTVGDILTAVVAAGAFAAFLSTASGLTVAIAGVLDQSVVRPLLSRTHATIDGIGGFRLATVLATTIPWLLWWELRGAGLATTVGLAFALAAATFCPLLVLGVWWPKLTAPGAAAGMITGAVSTVVAIVVVVTDGPGTGWGGVIVSQPAAWTVPLAFLMCVLVSWATPRQIPRHTGRTMARLHTPERPPAEIPSSYDG
ncbi:Cation/acetate symporter ActP [Austwickia sp. TVS 96-490-7B]|uniref:sodium/solute symporter n=1 Tax=Austwickia sp. TVS 96-490-7B TaxID=2830843 RepID=UPI001C57CBB8|nr:cation acetate symporter [Austwickia sp. TVS 96-490-7B]MBW3084907.1 Cation/acetate symporter ActP [Austwickia sp. TVS 96-490-7B]